jgi:energy-converting hydrogenase A subunit M
VTNDFKRMIEELGNEYRDVLWRLNDSKILHLEVEEVIEITSWNRPFCQFSKRKFMRQGNLSSILGLPLWHT